MTTISQYETLLSRAYMPVDLTVYHRTASDPLATIQRGEGWVYFYNVTLPNCGKLSGQIAGPFKTKKAALEAAALELMR